MKKCILAVFSTLIILLIMWHFSLPLQRGASIGHQIEKISISNPQYIFLGNSMVYSRFEEKKFSQLTDSKVINLAESGGASATYWLYAKNIISKSKAKKVVIFFRDTKLTDTHYRTDGNHLRRNAKLMTENEKIFFEILYLKSKNYLNYLLDEYIYRKSFLSSASIRKQISKINGIFFPNAFTSITRLFYQFKLKDYNTIPENCEEEKFNFKNRLDNSFLPHIIKEFSKQGKELILVRVENRPSRRVCTEITSYLRQLEKFLSDSGIKYIDLNILNNVPENKFNISDHIAHSQRDWYMQHFIENAWDKIK